MKNKKNEGLKAQYRFQPLHVSSGYLHGCSVLQYQDHRTVWTHPGRFYEVQIYNLPSVHPDKFRGIDPSFHRNQRFVDQGLIVLKIDTGIIPFAL